MKGYKFSATQWPALVCLYVFGLAFGVLPAHAAQALSVNLDANPLHVAPGEESTLSWSSSGARWCWAHGSWGGGRNQSGSDTTARLWSKRWYAITCSDGTQEVTDSVTVVVQNDAPSMTVNLTAEHAQVAPGGTTTLSWSSSGAKWCWAHGSWGGGRNQSGSDTTPRQWEQRWYGITCSDGSNEVTDGVTVTVGGAGDGDDTELAVTLDASPDTVKPGESSRLSWSAQGADACSASGGWSGNRSASGSFDTGALAETTSYRITCTRGSETALASVTVQVASAPVVHWQAPTRNVDGSALVDLVGYKFYWGTTSRNYEGSARVNSPSWTQYNPHHLAPGRYFIAVTAIDAQGHESGYSNEIRIDVP